MLDDLPKTTYNLDMKQELFNVVKSVIEALGLEIYHIEFHKNVLRVLIETKEGPLTVETCALVSRHLSERLDAVDLIPHRYRLEVSSPGIERALYEPAHYKRAVGSDCQLITKQGLFLGKILEADDEKIKLVPTKSNPPLADTPRVLPGGLPKAVNEADTTLTIFYTDIKSGHLKVSNETLFGSSEKPKSTDDIRSNNE
uniref:Ribosome maturation factor RimP n=1 Tax=candidate division WOR-3 bacterium TaxID=2052148 RepID=A0A7C6E9P6_UNCW3